jgi:hypothetical protein
MSIAEVDHPAQPGLLVRMSEAWNRFWFRPADPTPLCLIRIVGGLIVLYVHLAYSYDLQAFFGRNAWLDLRFIDRMRHDAPVVGVPFGWDDEPLPDLRNLDTDTREYVLEWGSLPKQRVSQGHNWWSIWFHVTDPHGMKVVHVCILAIMFLFAVGFATRITGVLTWAAILSYIQRGPNTLFGMDTIMIVVVLYLVIGPSGATLSVDRLISRWWANYRARRAGLPPIELPPLAPSVSANLAVRLLQVHICIIYMASGLSKLLGAAWWDGTAVWGTMANPEFSPMQYKLYMDFLRFITSHRWLWHVVITSGTAFTLVFEISFAFLVWNSRLRWTMLVAAVMLHLGIALLMGLVTFSMMMLTMVLAFIPAEAIHQLFRQLSRREVSWSLTPAEA